MSELKAEDVFDVYEEYLHTADEILVYRKPEADKVIAEKDAEIARLEAIRKVHVEAIESMVAGLHQDDKELRHQKYKRCLAMAKWCELERTERFSVLYPKDFGYLLMKKWRKKWLDLAEKFKEMEK